LGQHFIKFPGFEKAPAGFKVMATGEGVAGAVAISVMCAVLELAWRESDDKEPGNFGDPFGVNMYNDEFRNKEINNGRFAMICVLGIFAAEMATGKDAIEQFGLGALGRGATGRMGVASSFTGLSADAVASRSLTQRRAVEGGAMAVAEEPPAPPPFAPSEQIGAGAPLGFFDPLGFTKVGDEKGFRKLRASEIKHGRVAMMGSLGSVVAHYWKFPGFEKVPSGLAALNTDMGGRGFAVLFFPVGLIEAANWKESKDEPGSYGDPLNLNQFTPTMRNKELNNGRMAMISVLGIFAAEVMTGKDAMEQFGL